MPSLRTLCELWRKPTKRRTLADALTEDVFKLVGTLQAGAYQVQSVVAEGGFAVVYRAYHEAFRASVALKCLKVPDSLTQDQQREFLERFREEGEFLFRLSAVLPSVVRPLHVGVLTTPSGGIAPFMALEWLDGETLDRVIAKRREEGQPPMEIGRVVRQLAPVARTLERAHHFPGPDGPISILHRDLKPDNIFFAQVFGERKVKILDFGIAKVKSAASQIAGRQSATESEITAFTPAYGAPEQWVPKRYGQTGPWTDIYGLAVTMLEALVGRPPIEGDMAVMMGQAIAPAPRPTPRAHDVTVSDEVERIMTRAVAVDPVDRYQEIGPFWNDLEKALGLPSTAQAFAGALAPSMPPTPRTVALLQSPSTAPEADPTLHSAKHPSNAPAVPAPPGVPRFDDLRPAPTTPHRPKVEVLEPKSAGAGLEVPDLDQAALPRRPSRKVSAAPKPEPPRPQKLTLAGGVSRGSIPLAEPRMSSRPAPVPIARLPQPPSQSPSLGEIWSKLRAPFGLLLVAILLVVADQAYTHWMGEPFEIGVFRVFWVAAPLGVLGVGLAMWRLFLTD